MGKRKQPRRIRDRERQSARQAEPRKKDQWWKIPLEVLATLSAVLTIVGFALNSVPKLSVDAAGSLQRTSPMGTVFYLSNDGALPIHNVVVTCGNIHVEGEGFQVLGFGVEYQAPPEARADILSPGHKMTLPYAPAFGFGGVNNLKGARLVIRAHYRPAYVPWHKTETFPFQAIRATDGSWIWKSIPQ